MNRTRMSVAVVALATASALALTACGGGDSKSEAGPKKNSVPKSNANDVKPTDRDKLKQGGTVNWPLSQLPKNWNLSHANGSLADAVTVERALMPSVMLSDASGTVTPNPDYLTSAEVDASSGTEVVTYKINPKAKWSDGTPITWKDFEANWKAQNGKNPKYKPASTTGYELISSVAKGADDHEVVVTFSSSFGDWKSLFSPLYPASVIGTPEGFDTGYLGKIPVTAGPFKFQGINETTQTVTVVRDDNWWGDKAILDKMVFRALAGDAVSGAFANGEVDLFSIGPDPAAYKQATTVKDAEIRKAAGPNYRHVTLNGAGGALKDVKVRQAIMSALNREAIAQSDLEGLDWEAKPLNNHYFVTNQKGYKDNAAGIGVFDQAKAKSLLDEAGWKQSGEYRTKDGKTLELNFVIPASTAVSANEAKLAQPMLKAVGIKMNIKTVPLDDFWEKYVYVGNFDLTAFSWMGTSFPVSSTKAIYAKPVPGDSEGQNFTGVGSDELDAAMDKAIATTDPAQQIADANAADVMIWQQANLLPLYQRPDIYAVKKNLVNVGAFGFQDLRYENIGYLK